MERTYIKDVTPGVCRVSGFVENFRNKRTMAFIVVKDITGKLQITIEKEKHPEFTEMLDKLTIHSVVTFEGEVVARVSDSLSVSVGKIKTEKLEKGALWQKHG